MRDQPSPNELLPLFLLACPAGAICVLIGYLGAGREFVVGGVLVACAGAAGLFWLLAKRP